MPREDLYYLLYSLIGHLVLPIDFTRIALAGLKFPEQRNRWPERMGQPPFSQLSGCLWIHAVSVGEVQAALPLVRGLRSRFPEKEILVTTTTPTGSQRVIQQLGHEVRHSYLPYDLPAMVNAFLQHTNPKAALVMETELWPHLFRSLSLRRIPLLLVNARLSQTSYPRYRKIRPFVRSVLRHCRLILAQSETDARRYLDLCGDADKISVCGNVKFDLHVPPEVLAEGLELRRSLAPERPVWIAASTHDGEEEQILEAHRRVLAFEPEALLILVPRYPESFQRVYTLCRQHGFTISKRSQNHSGGQHRAEVYLGDTMGELQLLYAASDIAFVGGSLVHVGGHNILEPAALELPVITGPHLFNFSEIAKLLEAHAALVQVQAAEELAAQVVNLFHNEATRREMGRRAKQALESSRGATEKILDSVAQLIKAE